MEGVGVKNDMTKSDLKEHPLRNCAEVRSSILRSAVHAFSTHFCFVVKDGFMTSLAEVEVYFV